MGVANHERKPDPAFILRLVAFGCVMALVNVIPYLVTRDAHRTDGLEIAGWPLRCYEIGGVDGHMHFSPWAMAGNIVIAVALSAWMAWLFRDGVLRMLNKWRTWGTPYAE